MDAGRHQAAFMQRGDTPKKTDPKRVGFRAGEWCVVKIIKMVVQPFAKGFIIDTAIRFEKQRSCLRHIDTTDGLFVGQALGRRAVIGAEPGVQLGSGAVGMPGADIGAHGADFLRLHVTVYAIQHRFKPVLGEQTMIGKHRLDRRLTCDTQRQRVKHLDIESRDPLPQTQSGHDFTEIAIQRARPA